MVRSAAAVDNALLDAIVRLDDPRQPLAEIARRVAADAEARGRTRPSYEALRRLIKEQRTLRAGRGPSAAELLFLDGMSGVTRGLVDEILTPRDERRPRRRR
jgi:hypothetical protein